MSPALADGFFTTEPPGMPSTQFCCEATTALINKAYFKKQNPGNYIQYLLIIYKGKESEKEYIYKTEPLCSAPETNMTL